jgi:predicted DNA-binding protein YlxM (UPF0122 family)
MEQRKTIIIREIGEVEQYKSRIHKNLRKCAEMLKELLATEDALSFFEKAKYEKIVIDPLTEEPENLIEVINQCQTYLASFLGVEYLSSMFLNTSFRINLGNVSGYDIESEDGTVIAECFAATSYRSNGKLTKDLKRLSENKTAIFKYEFFYDTEFTDKSKIFYKNKYPDIEIVHFSDVE